VVDFGDDPPKRAVILWDQGREGWDGVAWDPGGGLAAGAEPKWPLRTTRGVRHLWGPWYLVTGG
jgi:hypothetical protein